MSKFADRRDDFVFVLVSHSKRAFVAECWCIGPRFTHGGMLLARRVLACVRTWARRSRVLAKCSLHLTRSEAGTVARRHGALT